MNVRMTMIADRLAEYQQDPVQYVREVFDASPSDQQVAYLNDMADPAARVSVRSGISTGKTTADAWLCHWFVDCFSHAKAAVTAPTMPQLRDALVAEVRLWHGRKLARFLPPTTISNELLVNEALGSFAVFKTASKERPEALQGLHGEHVMVIVDEASGVDDAVFEPLRGATGRNSTRIAFTANPTRASGMFHRTQTHSAYRENWKRHVWSSWDSPHSDKAYLQELADEYGVDSDMYRVRVLGEFPSASPSQLIPTDLVNAAMKRHLHKGQYDFAPVILGVDVAWEGNDRSSVYLRQGLYSKLLGVWHNIDNMTLAGWVNEYWDTHKVDSCFVDVGWGTGVIDRLRQLGRKPIPVNFGGKASDPQYANKRSEMWFKTRDWLMEGGAIEANEDLKLDLTAPEYGPADAGHKVLERKKETKKRAGFSPDLGDSLALTFAFPVVKQEDRPVKRTYDPMTYGMGG